jgi:hypothetical protein
VPSSHSFVLPDLLVQVKGTTAQWYLILCQLYKGCIPCSKLTMDETASIVQLVREVTSSTWATPEPATLASATYLQHFTTSQLQYDFTACLGNLEEVLIADLAPIWELWDVNKPGFILK